MSQINSGANSGLTAWYVSRSGETSGPFATDMVSAMLRDGRLEPMDLVFREGEVEWKPASVFPELKFNSKSISNSAANSAPTPESKVAAKTEANVEKIQKVKSDVATTPRSALSWIVLRPHRGTYLQEGPFETQTIIDGLQKGTFQFSQYAWHVGMNQWMRIGDLREFDRRTRSREARPHVPPPLPDPIEAVLLEDDKDQEAEEFHVAMKGSAKMELTPNPLEGLGGFNTTFTGSVAIGGAAAESPEEKQVKAGQAMALVMTSNLAGVPWEQGVAERSAGSAGLIDDEHSGVVRSSHVQEYEERWLSEPRPAVASEPAGTASGVRVAGVDSTPFQVSLDSTPKPFLPPAPMPIAKDLWQQWGRHVAGGFMAVVAVLFISHLFLHESPSELKSTPGAASAAAPAAPPVSISEVVAPKIANDPFGSKVNDPFGSKVNAPFGSKVNDPFGSMDANDSAKSSAELRPEMPISGSLGVVGLRLDRPDGQIVLQGQVPSGVPVAVSFKGRLGQVIGKMNVRKVVEVQARAGELPSLQLKDLKLPEGAYTVEVTAGSSKAKSEIFIGRRDARFLDRLETHLRQVSLETQSQKKALFYAAQELDTLARDLGQNYGQLRGKPEMWSQFYSKWTRKVASVGRSISGLEKKKPDDRAYPEETVALSQAYSNLQKLAAQYREAIGQKRDLASDELTELIAELSRQKAIIGEATARPTAETPDGLL